jgi:hypothetical protein
MSLSPAEFRREIVRPTLAWLDPLVPASEAAENLLVATAMVESGLAALRQRGGGPALGLYQIEPATHRDVHLSFLAFRPELSARVTDLAAPAPALEVQLVSNLRYATAIARLVYWRAREKLPAADDPGGLARYWKVWFNTRLGAGTEAAFLEHYRLAA